MSSLLANINISFKYAGVWPSRRFGMLRARVFIWASGQMGHPGAGNHSMWWWCARWTTYSMGALHADGRYTHYWTPDGSIAINIFVHMYTYFALCSSSTNGRSLGEGGGGGGNTSKMDRHEMVRATRNRHLKKRCYAIILFFQFQRKKKIFLNENNKNISGSGSSSRSGVRMEGIRSYEKETYKRNNWSQDGHRRASNTILCYIYKYGVRLTGMSNV